MEGRDARTDSLPSAGSLIAPQAVEQWELDSVSDTDSSDAESSRGSSCTSDGVADQEHEPEMMELDSTSGDEDSDDESMGSDTSMPEPLAAPDPEDVACPAHANAGPHLGNSLGAEGQQAEPLAKGNGEDGAPPQSLPVEERIGTQPALAGPFFDDLDDVLLPDLDWDITMEKHRLSEDSAGEEGAAGSPVGQRTRARNPLEGVTLEELEALLQEDIVETPVREDAAYREFLQALQGEGPAEAGLLPEEEEDDADFLVDLDELTGGCEENLLPTLPTSPLQTRFGRSPQRGDRNVPCLWVPQNPTAENDSLANHSTALPLPHPQDAGQPAREGEGEALPQRRSRRKPQTALKIGDAEGEGSESRRGRGSARGRGRGRGKGRGKSKAAENEAAVDPDPDLGAGQSSMTMPAYLSGYPGVASGRAGGNPSLRPAMQGGAAQGVAAVPAPAIQGAQEWLQAERVAGSNASTGGAPVQQPPEAPARRGGRRPKVATSPTDSELGIVPRLPTAAAHSGPIGVWTMAHKAQYRKQVGQHIQQLCHSIALLKCATDDESLDPASRKLLFNHAHAVLNHMQTFCLAAAARKAAVQAPLLPAAVTLPLDTSCSSTPGVARPACRSLLDVPILQHVSSLLLATQPTPPPLMSNPSGTNAVAMAGGEAAQEAEIKLALLMLTPHMNPQLFPEFKALPEGCARSWTKSEYKLLEYGLKHYSAKSVESIRKYFLPAKTTDSILAHIRMAHEKRPAHPGCGAPLTEAELDIVRATLKELNGAGRVWDVLALERLTNRSAEEIRRLYYQQGYGAAASGSWRAQGEKPRNGRVQAAAATNPRAGPPPVTS